MKKIMTQLTTTEIPALVPKETTSIKPFDFNTLFQKHPELLQFLSGTVQATNDYDQKDQATWAAEMYQAANLAAKQKASARSIELERTVLCLLSLDAVTQGNYSFFKNAPYFKGSFCMTEQQFYTLHELVDNYYPKTKNKILQTELVLGDLGKIQSLKESLGKEFKIAAKDPDQFLQALLKQEYSALTQRLPSIQALKEKDFKKIHRVSLHWGHVCHAECPPKVLIQFKKDLLELEQKEKGSAPIALHQALLVQLFDVAGAAAQAQGKMLLDQSLFVTYIENILRPLFKLATEEKYTGEEAYRDYLAQRLERVEMKYSNDNDFLGRLICMFRIFSAEEAKALAISLETLKQNAQFTADLATLSAYEKNDAFSTPTYMPAFLVKLKSSPRITELKQENEDAQATALRVGMHIIANTLKAYQTCYEQNQKIAINPPNFNGLTGLVEKSFDSIRALYQGGNVDFDANGIAKLGQIVTTSACLFQVQQPQAALRSCSKSASISNGNSEIKSVNIPGIS
jgi:hypothetical protein